MSLHIDLDWRLPDDGPQGFTTRTRELPRGLTGLNVRLDAIAALDIQRGFFNPRSSADVYPLFLVLAPNVANPIQIPPVAVYNDVMPGDDLPISNVAAPTLFRTGASLPDWIDVHVLLMKSRERQRQLAGGIHTALESPTGKALTTGILSALSTSNPLAGTAAALGVQLLDLVCQELSQGKDAQLFYARASIERADGYCIDEPIVLTDDRHARFELRVQGVVGP